MVSLVTCLLILYELQCIVAENSQKRRILPADPYQLLGEPGLRRNGRCNISYAWLIPPAQSTLDAYGHALACARLQLHDGHVVSNVFKSDNKNHDVANRPDDELESIDKQLAASMVDLNRLDTLMRAEQITYDHKSTTYTKQLADRNRYFYLADRVGDLNIMVVLRPGQAIKLELINPSATEHPVTPEHVLCSRQQCPKVVEIVPSTTPEVKILENNSQNLVRAMAIEERRNRDLYMQLIISRVACVLLSLLCIVFGACALVLCLRLRSINSQRRKCLPSDLSMCRDPLPSPSYMQPNGKLSHGRGTPIYPNADMSPRHAPSETTSVTNMLMTGSNLSECGGLHGAQLSYTNPYGQLYAYPAYTDGNGVVNLVSMPSRTGNGGVVLPYPNGSASPAPSNHSLHECSNPHTGVSVVRSGSIGRYQNSHVYYTENGRRKLVRLNKQNLPVRPTEIYRQGLLNTFDYDPKLANLQDTKPVNTTHQEHGTMEQTVNSSPGNDLISFPTGRIQRLPVLISTPSNRPPYHTNGCQLENTANGFEYSENTPKIIAPTDCETALNGGDDDRAGNTKANCLANHINDPGVVLTRKPAVAKCID